MENITSKNNPIIKEIRSLSKKKYRWKNKLYIIEGIKLLEEALDNDVKVKYILYSKTIYETQQGKNILSRLEKYQRLFQVDETIFRSLSDTENPQGILGVVEFDINDYKELLYKEETSLFYLDAVMDPGNLGTIIRSADAFNIDGIIMGEGSVDPYNPKVVRATMGSLFRVPLYFDNNYSILKDLKTHQFKIHTTYLKGSLANHRVTYQGKYIVVIGNESTGVSENVVKMSDTLIKIPIPGRAESLNAGVAASILMYEAAKQSGEKS